MKADYFTYASGDGTRIRSYFNAPAGAAGGVMLLRGVAGPDSGYTEIAERLAESGFAALVHGWQARGNDPQDAVLLADIEAGLAFMAARPALAGRPLGVFGYCKGGGYAVLAAARFPAIRALVAFHGFARRPDGATAANRNPIDAVGEVRQPVLLLHGGKDSVSPVAAMRELCTAFQRSGVPCEMHVYPQADHGFAVSTHKGYRSEAASDAYTRALDFLRRHARQRDPS
ncbi:MAG: dienelactone hydrolase family protein [Burkholderiales bacterium]|nr:dienelactone hydrolase family protein [Burkholderiales bacterium]